MPPNKLAPLAMPRALTISVPPDTTLAAAVPLEPTTCAPANTVPPLARPNTRCVPPEMCAPSSVPWALTISVPPARMIVGSATPPEETISLPPPDTVASISVPPAETIGRTAVDGEPARDAAGAHGHHIAACDLAAAERAAGQDNELHRYAR